MKNECFTAYNSVEIMAKELLSVAALRRIRSRLTSTMEGKRLELAEAPKCGGNFNPLRRKHNIAMGINFKKKVLMPYPLKDDKEIARAADGLLLGRTMMLSDVDIDGVKDGACFDILDMGRDLLWQAKDQGTLLDLPLGIDRELQMITDGTGWQSRTGCMRTILRCTQLSHGANDIQNARDGIFILGSDKHRHVEQAMEIGGDRSYSRRMYDGLVVTTTPEAELPEHVRADKVFAVLAAIR